MRNKNRIINNISATRKATKEMRNNASKSNSFRPAVAADAVNRWETETNGPALTSRPGIAVGQAQRSGDGCGCSGLPWVFLQCYSCRICFPGGVSASVWGISNVHLSPWSIWRVNICNTNDDFTHGIMFINKYKLHCKRQNASSSYLHWHHVQGVAFLKSSFFLSFSFEGIHPSVVTYSVAANAFRYRFYYYFFFTCFNDFHYCNRAHLPSLSCHFFRLYCLVSLSFYHVFHFRLITSGSWLTGQALPFSIISNLHCNLVNSTGMYGVRMIECTLIAMICLQSVGPILI